MARFRMPRLLCCGAMFAIVGLLVLTQPASALITVLKGNAPVGDRNWPAGSLELGNVAERIGLWEGPPLGGGQTQFVYRGNEEVLQRALDLFAKINAPELSLNLYESPHTVSFLDDQPVGFTFTVWDPRSFHMLYNNPSNTFFSRDPSGRYRGSVDPPTFNIYLPAPGSPGLDWSKIKLPAGLTVQDHRATAHGYTREDGSVIAGALYDMLTSKPVTNARIEVTRRKEGTTEWETIAQTRTDERGKFEIKKLRSGYVSLIFAADNYASRQVSENLTANLFIAMTMQLAAATSVKGAVHDTAGQPLAHVKVRASNVMGLDGRSYAIPGSEITTDDQGNFTFTNLPHGYVQLYAMSPAFFHINSQQTFSAPNKGVTLVMTVTGAVKGKVFGIDGSPHPSANVNINAPGEPESRIGKWGGSMNANPDGTFEFTNVPPGRYVISTNSSLALEGKDPEAEEIEVKAGETLQIDLLSTARPRPARVPATQAR